MAFIGKAGRVADAVKRSPKVLRKKIERKFGSHESKFCRLWLKLILAILCMVSDTSGEH